ncbi:MAG: fibronectin type III domain-containing protein [Elusimicrobiota bacterium]
MNDSSADTNTIATATISGLAPNILYFVSVQASRPGHVPSGFSSADHASTLANSVGIDSFGVNQSSISAYWALPSGGASGFILSVSTNSNFVNAASSTSHNPLITTLIVKNLIPLTTYFIRAGSLNLDGAANWGGIISTTTPSLPAGLQSPAVKPTSAAIISRSTDSLTVTWKEKNTGLTDFILVASSVSGIIESIVSSVTWSDSEAASNKTATATVAGLAPNTLYYVAVAAAHNGAWSDYSSPDKGVTSANAPAGLQAIPASSNSSLLRWQANGNPKDTLFEITISLDGFRLDISTPVTFAKKLTAYETTLNGLMAGLAYWARARAINREGVPGDYSEHVIFKIPTPPATSSSTLKQGGAAVLIAAGQETRLHFDPGAFQSDAVIFISTDPINNPLHVDKIKLETAVSNLKGERYLPGLMREFSALVGNEIHTGAFLSPVRLEMSYAFLDRDRNGFLDSLNPPLRVERLAIWVLDENQGVFVRCPDSRVDILTQEVACALNHFSVYALLVSAPTMAGGEIYAYPVPWRPHSPDPVEASVAGITFDNLPNQGEVVIYTLLGDWVETLSWSATTQVKWDGRNARGSSVASGIYIWRATGNGISKTGKLMIIR